MSTTDYQTLSYDITDDAILTLTLNRPEAMNSFTVQMADELEHAFTQASDDDAIGAIVVTGSGKAFCAGMDLTREGNVFGLNEDLTPTIDDMTHRRDALEIQEGVRDTGGRVALAIFNCKKPVIAAINGAAVGIGATMLLPMDIRLASEKAKIGFVFGKIGITPEACSTWFLPRIVGMSKALEWVYTGEILSPETAKDAGLVSAIHAPDELLPAAYALAKRCTANKSPVATALARQMMYRNSAQPHPMNAHIVDSLAIFYTSMSDGKEGVASFLEKRPADYKDKASQMPHFYPWWE